MSAQDVPDDVLALIFARLSRADLSRCAAVCKEWRRLATADALWERFVVTESALAPPLPSLRPLLLRAPALVARVVAADVLSLPGLLREMRQSTPNAVPVFFGVAASVMLCAAALCVGLLGAAHPLAFAVGALLVFAEPQFLAAETHCIPGFLRFKLLVSRGVLALLLLLAVGEVLWARQLGGLFAVAFVQAVLWQAAFRRWFESVAAYNGIVGRTLNRVGLLLNHFFMLPPVVAFFRRLGDSGAALFILVAFHALRLPDRGTFAPWVARGAPRSLALRGVPFALAALAVVALLVKLIEYVLGGLLLFVAAGMVGGIARSRYGNNVNQEVNNALAMGSVTLAAMGSLGALFGHGSVARTIAAVAGLASVYAAHGSYFHLSVSVLRVATWIMLGVCALAARDGLTAVVALACFAVAALVPYLQLPARMLVLQPMRASAQARQKQPGQRGPAALVPSHEHGAGLFARGLAAGAVTQRWMTGRLSALQLQPGGAQFSAYNGQMVMFCDDVVVFSQHVYDRATLAPRTSLLQGVGQARYAVHGRDAYVCVMYPQYAIQHLRLEAPGAFRLQRVGAQRALQQHLSSGSLVGLQATESWLVVMAQNDSALVVDVRTLDVHPGAPLQRCKDAVVVGNRLLYLSRSFSRELHVRDLARPDEADVRVGLPEGAKQFLGRLGSAAVLQGVHSILLVDAASGALLRQVPVSATFSPRCVVEPDLVLGVELSPADDSHDSARLTLRVLSLDTGRVRDASVPVGELLEGLSERAFGGGGSIRSGRWSGRPNVVDVAADSRGVAVAVSMHDTYSGGGLIMLDVL